MTETDHRPSQPTVARGRQQRTVRFARRIWRSDRIAAATAVLVLGVLVAVFVGAGGAHSLSPRIGDVGAWLGNDSQGSVTHANGVAGTADAHVGLANSAGHPLVVVQSGGTILIEDTVTGVVTRVDPAQLTVVQSVTYGDPHVQIVAGGGRAYAVDPVRGLVQAIDPDRLTEIGVPVRLTAPLGAAAVDPSGTLWVPVRGAGTLVPVTGDRTGAPVPVGTPGDDLDLTIAAGTPVVTDATASTLTVLGPRGARRTVNLPGVTSALLAPRQTDGTVVPLLATPSHQMIVVDTATGRPVSVGLDGLDGHDLGTPEALGTRVYVPDDTTGRLVVFDAASGRMLNQVTVSGKAGRLSVFLNDGLLWANDATGSTAVCVDATGAVHTISKYAPGLPGGPAPSVVPPAPTSSGPGTRGHHGGSGGGGNGHGGGSGGNGGKPSHHPTPPPSSTPPPAPPDSPHNVAEAAGPGYIDVTFSPSAGATPTGYAPANLPAGAVATPARVPAAGPYSVRITGLDCAQAYPVTIDAVYPTASVGATGPATHPCLPPGAPQGVALNTGTQHQVTASWSAPASDGGGAVTYQAAVNGGGPVDVGAATSHTFTGLANFAGYSVTVTASNGAGSSQPASSPGTQLAAGPWPGHIGNNSVDPVNLRAAPSTSAQILRQFPPNGHTPVTAVCVVTGSSWSDPSGSPSGNTWYRVSQPQAGYVATGYIPDISGVWWCT